jgi:hypothetical protein
MWLPKHAEKLDFWEPRTNQQTSMRKQQCPAQHGIGFVHLRCCRNCHRSEILGQCIKNENLSGQNRSFRESVVDSVSISRNERIPALLVNKWKVRGNRQEDFVKRQYDLRGTFLIVECDGMTYPSGSHDIPKHRGGRRNCTWVSFLTSGDWTYLIDKWSRFTRSGWCWTRLRVDWGGRSSQCQMTGAVNEICGGTRDDHPLNPSWLWSTGPF